MAERSNKRCEYFLGFFKPYRSHFQPTHRESRPGIIDLHSLLHGSALCSFKFERKSADTQYSVLVGSIISAAERAAATAAIAYTIPPVIYNGGNHETIDTRRGRIPSKLSRVEFSVLRDLINNASQGSRFCRLCIRPASGPWNKQSQQPAAEPQQPVLTSGL